MVEIGKLFGWPSKRAFFIKANLFSVLFFGMLYFGSYRWELGRDKREGEVDKSDGFFLLDMVLFSNTDDCWV